MKSVGTSGPGTAVELSRYWLLLAGCFLGAMCGVSSLYFYTQGLFMKPISAEFGWSRTVITTGGLLNVLGNAVMAPLCGMAIDRIGARRFATLTLLTSAVSLWTLSRLSGEVWQYYSLLLLVAVLSTGTSMVSFGRAINEWFISARGLALGIVAAGLGVSAALAPAYFATEVSAEGWRQGYVTMALMVVAATPFVWLMMRQPTISPQQAVAHATRIQQGLTAHQALRTPRFYLLAAMLFSASMAVSAIIVHFVPMLTDAGMTPQRAAGLAALVGLSVTLSRLLGGYLLDHFFAPYIALVTFSVAGVGALLLARAVDEPVLSNRLREAALKWLTPIAT